MKSPYRYPSLVLALTLAGATLTACGGGDANGHPGAQMPPPEVAVETVTPGALTVSAELPGRVQAIRTAEVRARVEGILEKRVFTEGSEVKAGASLFRIDPSELKAAQQSAEAALARAEANLSLANLKAERYAKLVGNKAVSKQEYDEAAATAKQAQADVASAKAALVRAQLDLGYADVRAPIAGRIGRALVTEGALVGRNDATHLATIEQLDPIYVNFTQSSLELLELRKRFHFGLPGGLTDPEVSVKLEDGTTYAHTGKLLFSEMTVDPSTGEVLLRAEIPNPERQLLPGMFVRVNVQQGVLADAITVPQRALVRGAHGAMVMVVGADGKVAPMPVDTAFAQGDRWVLNSGLKGGEQVIVEGLMKVRPGMPAKAVPAGVVVAHGQGQGSGGAKAAQ